MEMEKELPKIDLPEEWLVGTGISKELLGLYRNYPVRLKCEIFVLCTSGEVEASVNLNKITVEANDFIVLTPGSIFQINDIKGDLNIYFGGFSSEYIERNLQSHSFLDTMFLTLGRPVIRLKPEGAKMMEEYMQLLIKMYEFLPEKIRPEMAPNLYADIHKGISILYRNKTDGVHSLSKSELICRNFAQLVMQHYNQTRNVAWYAEKLADYACSPLYYSETDYGKDLRGYHFLHGHYGRQVTAEIIPAFHSEYFRFTELCQCVFFRKILQTLCRHESAGIQK